MVSSEKPVKIASLSFEGALAELEDIVRKLEQGKSDLEAAISAYERGAALKEHCEKKLKEAKTRVDKIKLGSNESIELEPIDLE